ncbi:MAG: phosphoribosylanthranilate isomerase [Alphaproteobacteria bacterium]|nr:MAG: phosphoribosylanthranilate isomerase [Alphaproteobacteria bacterium]TAF13627.1 MAG: phosphoribosylanthranilate isomerase [Alphaproteobacteria bacterium]TAF41726.1 MAG: phosphoribosylanthranilate isomerase [Alphaproteobacteria bacterium]TAF75667.1 MAG: phosphoribosylanthranilate isomerase [Alphaproteobacteria bacterium]
MKAATLKICGLSSEEAIDAGMARGIGFMGFIMVEHSLRYVAPDRFAPLARRIPSHIHSVLVSMDASNEALDAYVTHHRPSMMQLHGHESPQRMAEVKARYDLPIIKAYGVSAVADLHAAIRESATVADWLLWDTKRCDGTSGGTGQTFDWSILTSVTIPLPYFLSGGIDAWNIVQATQQTNAEYFDVSSSLEYPKGVKDVGRIHQFIDHYERCVR